MILIIIIIIIIIIIKANGKSKIHPTTGHEVPKGE
jgi:hypothetical protein